MCDQADGRPGHRFQNRGYKRKISTPFDIKSEECRLCGACMYVCPACAARCGGPNADTDICNACLQVEPTCLEGLRRADLLDVRRRTLRHVCPGNQKVNITLRR